MAAAKRYASPVSATSGGRTVTPTSGFDFQHAAGFLLVCHSNHGPKTHRLSWEHGTHSRTDRRTDRRADDATAQQ